MTTSFRSNVQVKIPHSSSGLLGQYILCYTSLL